MDQSEAQPLGWVAVSGFKSRSICSSPTAGSLTYRVVFRIRLQRHTKKLGHDATLDEELNVHDRRQRLATQIEGFTSKAATFLNIAQVDDVEAEVDEADGIHSDIESDAEDIIPEESFRLELMTLPLPSSFGAEWCAQPQHRGIVEQELTLRKGQANDSLHQLRLGLAEKMFLFRNEIRHANSQAKKTRAWDGFHSLENNLRHHVQVYSHTRNCLIRLGADADLLKKYQVLKDDDTKVSTAVIDITKATRAESTLAWFWRTDVERETDTDGWMAERELRLYWS
jgi:hypothetical protein